MFPWQYRKNANLYFYFYSLHGCLICVYLHVQLDTAYKYPHISINQWDLLEQAGFYQSIDWTFFIPNLVYAIQCDRFYSISHGTLGFLYELYRMDSFFICLKVRQITAIFL